MHKIIHDSVVVLLFLFSIQSFAQEGGANIAPLPRSEASGVRLIPVAGASTFATSNCTSLNNHNQGFSAGLLGDFGPDFLVLETDLLSLNGRAQRVDNSSSATINSWGVPFGKNKSFGPSASNGFC